MKKSNGMKSSRATIFICTFLFGMAAHAYRYFSLLYSHDSLMVYQDDTHWQISLGRFLQPVYLLLRGQLTAPFLLGMLSLLWLSLAACLIAELLEFKSTLLIILLCGILSTNAAITLTNATYIPWSDIFMLSLLFSVLAVYIYSKLKYGYLFGAVFICLSLSLYQSYFQTAVIFFMILIVKYIFDGHTFKFVLVKGVKALCTLILGLILYYLVLKIILFIKAIEPVVNYNGITDVGNYAGISIPRLFFDTYTYPIKYILHPETYNSKISAIMNCVGAFLSGLGIIKIVWDKKISEMNVILLVVLIFLMPFGMNTVYFISKGIEHSLMIFSFFFVYVFALLVLKHCCQKRIRCRRYWMLNRAYKWVVAASCAFIIFNNIVFANQVYLKKDLEYQATLTAITRIFDRIEQTEGYVMNETPVALIGNLDSSKLMADRPGFQLPGTGLSSKASTTYYLTYVMYFDQILGYPVNLVSEAEAGEIAQKEIVRNMPVFPDKDSCKMVEGHLVVKLS